MKTCVDLINYCIDYYCDVARPPWNYFDYKMWILTINSIYMGVQNSTYLDNWKVIKGD
jgi:hypothetical protein